jgi:hypothetical protein
MGALCIQSVFWTTVSRGRGPDTYKRTRRQEHPVRRMLAHMEIDPASGCWLITSKSGNEYGHKIVHVGTRETRHNHVAHRVMWEFVYGPVPDGLFVLHLCDTPACVNLSHLMLGNQKENLRQMRERGRSAEQTGKVIRIRGRYASAQPA